MPTEFHSPGKLLLTGEYLVLDGAKALAVPTKLRQFLTISEGEKGKIHWKSLDEKRKIWFSAEFLLKPTQNQLEIFSEKNDPVSLRLLQILQQAIKLNPKFFSEGKGYKITAQLEFPRNWGLGSSSTLINNLAKWMQVDAFELQEKTFGGSGYDIACAQSDRPIVFQLEETRRKIEKKQFAPKFKDQLFFVYLNQKQNSRKAIEHYKNRSKTQLSKTLQNISQITDAIVDCKMLTDFEKLLTEHEKILSEILGIPPVKKRLFSDYPKAIKSLGAWGGDFVLAVGGEKEKSFFRKKGFEVVLDYEKLIG